MGLAQSIIVATSATQVLYMELVKQGLIPRSGLVISVRDCSVESPPITKFIDRSSHFDDASHDHVTANIWQDPLSIEVAGGKNTNAAMVNLFATTFSQVLNLDQERRRDAN